MIEPPPDHCPGTGTEQSGKADACAGCPNQAVCAAAGPAEPDPDIAIIAERLAGVKHKVLVLRWTLVLMHCSVRRNALKPH